MRILVACEFSGVVRDAFSAVGHSVYSCDLIPTETRGKHIEGDVTEILKDRWDMMIAFPPCTHLALSGARYWKDKLPKQRVALDFIRRLMGAPIDKICIENPIGKISTAICKPDQIIQPWQFGHNEVKATCLWLKGLSLLTPTKVVSGRVPRVHWEAPGPDRWKRRSRTLSGIANAMAVQWG